MSRRENRFDGLNVVHAAVSDHNGVVGFIPAGPFDTSPPASAHTAASTCARSRLTTCSTRSSWDRVYFIKMDVEGSEVAALIGMSLPWAVPTRPRSWSNRTATLAPFGETPGSLKATLAAYGYRIFQVERRRLIPVAIDELQLTAVVDYLAVKSTPLLPFVAGGSTPP